MSNPKRNSAAPEVRIRLPKEQLFEVPEVKKALSEFAGYSAIGSKKQIAWVIKSCFPLKRKGDFLQEAHAIMQDCAEMVDKGLTDESMRECSIKIGNALATTAAVFYLIGAAAGASGLASFIERNRRPEGKVDG